MPPRKRLEKMTRPAELQDGAGVILGETYTDRVTQIRGTAVSLDLSLTGCDRVTLLIVPPDTAKDPAPFHYTVDATRLAELAETPLPDGSARPAKNGPPEVITRIGHTPTR